MAIRYVTATLLLHLMIRALNFHFVRSDPIPMNTHSLAVNANSEHSGDAQKRSVELVDGDWFMDSHSLAMKKRKPHPSDGKFKFSYGSYLPGKKPMTVHDYWHRSTKQFKGAVSPFALVSNSELDKALAEAVALKFENHHINALLDTDTDIFHGIDTAETNSNAGKMDIAYSDNISDVDHTENDTDELTKGITTTVPTEAPWPVMSPETESTEHGSLDSTPDVSSTNQDFSKSSSSGVNDNNENSNIGKDKTDSQWTLSNMKRSRGGFSGRDTFMKRPFDSLANGLIGKRSVPIMM